MRFIQRALMAPFVVLAIDSAIASDVMDTVADWLAPKDEARNG
jgi:hypothetical protein